MAKILNVNRKRVLLAGGLACLLLAVTLVVNVRTHSQNLQTLDQRAENDLAEQIENSLDQPLRIVGNDDCPLGIVEAKVKEVSGRQFTRLTGRTTNLVSVSSVPEVELANTSGRVVTEFAIAVRDPQSRTSLRLNQRRVSVAPGDTYTVKREHFVGSEKVTTASENGRIWHTLVRPKMNSEKYWLQFAERSDLFVSVRSVTFDDGTSWMRKGGGEVR